MCNDGEYTRKIQQIDSSLKVSETERYVTVTGKNPVAEGVNAIEASTDLKLFIKDGDEITYRKLLKP